MGFPSGPISVRDASYTDETNGRNWIMQQASDVRFLAVRGTIMIGDVPLYYQFTLVKYQMYIDTVPWVIFSNLNDALLKEFDPQFFTTLNCERKDRWGFQSVAWRDRTAEYDVDTPYSDTWLSIFNTYGHTCREVKPFQYNYDYLRVHVNGAAIYSEEKKLAFLLPLIVEAHRLLPDKPIFWENDYGTLSLYRTFMWMHEDTVKWLAETGTNYPGALRTLIQPRIDAIRTRQHGKRQPPPPSQPNRWQERKFTESDRPSTQDPIPSQLQQVKLSPRHIVTGNLNTNHDKHYMKMQEDFLEIAALTPMPKSAAGETALASQSAADEEHSQLPERKSPESTAGVRRQCDEKTARVKANRAAQRPVLSAPKEKVNKRGNPNKASPEQETPEEGSQVQEPPSFGSSFSSSSSSDAPDELNKAEEPGPKEGTGQSSGESGLPELAPNTIDRADLPTLTKMQRAAEERVELLESELTVAKNLLQDILTRKKIVKASESRDVELETVD